jgi:hypothetical protein
MGNRFEKLGTQCVDLQTEVTFELSGRSLRSAIGLGMDQIHDSFGLGEVEFPVVEGALGELTRAGHSGPGCQHGREHTRSHDRATMPADLDQILARVAPGIAEDSQQHLIEHDSLGIYDLSKKNTPLLGYGRALRRSEDRIGDLEGFFSADTYHGKRPLSRRRCNRSDGFSLHGF